MSSDPSQPGDPPATADDSSADTGQAGDTPGNPGEFQAPRPGSRKMPPWNTGELV